MSERVSECARVRDCVRDDSRGKNGRNPGRRQAGRRAGGQEDADNYSLRELSERASGRFGDCGRGRQRRGGVRGPLV